MFRELLHSTFDVVTEEALMERIFCAWEKGHEGLPLRLEGWLVSKKETVISHYDMVFYSKLGRQKPPR